MLTMQGNIGFEVNCAIDVILTRTNFSPPSLPSTIHVASAKESNLIYANSLGEIPDLLDRRETAVKVKTTITGSS
jgi:hypothetical protein